MHKASCILSLLSLAVSPTPRLMAQSQKMEAADLPEHPFQVDYPSGRQLNLRLRSGDVRLVGKEGNQISVRLEARDTEGAREVKVFFERFDNSAELRVSGGPKNNLRIIVEVPKKTGLFVRMPAGQLEITDITGDKDVQLHAGELILHVGDPADYSHVDASVTSGGLQAPPFHEDHGGLFRSFQRSGNGKYRLHAHVGAGDLTLR